MKILYAITSSLIDAYMDGTYDDTLDKAAGIMKRRYTFVFNLLDIL